mmetsp:Transcript_24394/g.81901  ORF Transcript_24394/g.81901 Transcript_24394/m.81901 type:complete len:102 (+) Transcript_24394:124-429(+)
MVGTLACELGVELTLHTSWAITERDMALLPGLPTLARTLAGFARGCLRELLLTVDSPEKARRAARPLEGGSLFSGSPASGGPTRRRRRGAHLGHLEFVTRS